jgi:hypothetical protein
VWAGAYACAPRATRAAALPFAAAAVQRYLNART